jgi:hypothetical protein
MAKEFEKLCFNFAHAHEDGRVQVEKRKTPSITSLVAIQISFKVGSFLSVKSIERILLSREGREKTLMETDERLRKRKR